MGQGQEEREVEVQRSYHTGRAIRWGFARASTGSPELCVVFRITEGDKRGQEYPWYGFLTPAALERTLRSLRDAGWVGDDLKKLNGLGSCDVPITVEEEGGVTRVAWVGAGDGLPVRDMIEGKDLDDLVANIQKTGAIARSKLPPEPVTGQVAKPQRKVERRGEDMPPDDRFG